MVAAVSAAAGAARDVKAAADAESAALQALDCAVCLDRFDAPIVQCSAGHSFCLKCIRADVRTCPSCRVPLPPAHAMTRNRALEDVLALPLFAALRPQHHAGRVRAPGGPVVADPPDRGPIRVLRQPSRRRPVPMPATVPDSPPTVDGNTVLRITCLVLAVVVAAGFVSDRDACPIGWYGRECAVNVDDCVTSSGASVCLHGGTCVDALASFVCRCAPGFTGDTCEREVSTQSTPPGASGGPDDPHSAPLHAGPQVELRSETVDVESDGGFTIRLPSPPGAAVESSEPKPSAALQLLYLAVLFGLALVVAVLIFSCLARESD